MAINRVGFTKALGNTIAWPSGHQAGDLAVVFAHATNSANAITAPAGWNLLTFGTNFLQPRYVFYCWANSSSMANATFANAEFLHLWAGRGTDALLTPGNAANFSTSGTTSIAYNSLAFQSAEGVYLASACLSVTDNPAYTTTPTGLTLLDSQLDLATQIGATNLLQSDPRSSWNAVTVTGSGTAGVVTRLVCEVFEIPVTFSSGGSTIIVIED